MPHADGEGLGNIFTMPAVGADGRYDLDSFTDVPRIPENEVTSADVKRKKSASSGFFTKKIKPKDLMHFSRQMAAFLRAGIPILDSLEMLASDSENPTLTAVLNDVEAALRQGSSLSESLDSHPKAFPDSYRSMVRSAELTGNLDIVLERLADYLERDTEARDKIKSAMTYPAVIAVMSIGVIVLLVTFVLPKFKPFFASFQKELPLPTRMLITFGDVAQSFWYFFVLGAAVGAGAFLTFMRHPRTRPVYDRLKLRVPVLGEVFRYAIVERFCRVLGSMLTAGVPIGEALRIASDATGNLHVRKELEGARTLTMQGAGIAQPLSRLALFPKAATQMIRVGESTGSLDKQLEQAAKFFERQLDYKIKRFTTLLEPAIIIVMGGLVGFVALALISAMYGMFQGGSLG